jgi:hypothetical protein
VRLFRNCFYFSNLSVENSESRTSSDVHQGIMVKKSMLDSYNKVTAKGEKNFSYLEVGCGLMSFD